MERKVSLICTICKSQEEKLKLIPGTNMTFIYESANFKSSTLSDHIATDGHKRAVKEKNTGSSTSPEKVIHEVLTYSAIVLDIRKMT